jgi:hypothetical protein
VRRVRLSAAIDEAPAAPASAQDTVPDGDGPRTAPLLAAVPRSWTRPRGIRRVPRPGRGLPRVRIWPASSPSPQRRWRGLLVTPWFAAGAGFVIAAGLALHSPHTVLTYRPKTQPCKHSCEQPLPSGGSAAVVTPGVRIKPARPAHHRRHHPGPARHPSAGAPVGFKVIWHQSGRFGAFVTIPRRQARHAWSLRFDIPGAKIIQVWGAKWEGTADGHGGLARRAGDLPGPPGGDGGGNGGDGQGQGQGGGWHGLNGLNALSSLAIASGHNFDVEHGGGFVVIAEGDPAIPAGCLLNGRICHFG